MKRILFLFLPFLPYLASAQVAKDTVTVLTIADIPAGAIRDTTNFTFVQDNGFKKATFDSLAKYTRVKLIGDRGDITVSGSTGLTWELDAGVVDSMQLSAGAVVLPGAKVTGTLPVSKGGTGTGTQFTAGSVVFAGASGVYSQNNSGLFWDNTNRRLTVGSNTDGANLNIYTSSYGNNGLINAYNANNVIKLQMGALADDVGYIYTPTSTRLDLFSGNARTMTLSSNQNVGIGVVSPSSTLHLKAGTASANTSPLKFTSGTNLTAPEAGAMEFNGTNLFFTPSTTRHTVNHGLAGSATLDFASTNAQNSQDLTITVTGASNGDVVSLGVPNGSVNANTCFTAWVSATNTVTVRFNNYSSGAVDPASGVFKVFVTK